MTPITRTLLLSLLCALAGTALAGDSPQERRHELMESVGDAAKPVGDMLKGEREFDAAIVMESLHVFRDAAIEVADLFPEGTETGYDTEAKSTIWTDREGFEAALADFSAAVDAAIAAEPQNLEELNTVGGPVFKQCKACHEDYRIED